MITNQRFLRQPTCLAFILLTPFISRLLLLGCSWLPSHILCLHLSSLFKVFPKLLYRPLEIFFPPQVYISWLSEFISPSQAWWCQKMQWTGFRWPEPHLSALRDESARLSWDFVVCKYRMFKKVTVCFLVSLVLWSGFCLHVFSLHSLAAHFLFSFLSFCRISLHKSFSVFSRNSFMIFTLSPHFLKPHTPWKLNSECYH